MNPVAGLLFACLVCSGLYINKYVLSVLGFKYPTIFQGWQTLAGLIIYKLLTVSCAKANFKLVSIDRPAFISLLPGFLFFTTSLVAGSKALSGKMVFKHLLNVLILIELQVCPYPSLSVCPTPSQPPSTSLTGSYRVLVFSIFNFISTSESSPEAGLQSPCSSWRQPLSPS